MDGDFEMMRAERRSFFCPNKLWKELKHITKFIPISVYIRIAIIEKMIKDNPQKEKYYRNLLVYSGWR